MFIMFSAGAYDTGTISAKVNDTIVGTINSSGAWEISNMSFIVPPKTSYIVTSTSSTETFDTWVELKYY